MAKQKTKEIESTETVESVEAIPTPSADDIAKAKALLLIAGLIALPTPDSASVYRLIDSTVTISKGRKMGNHSYDVAALPDSSIKGLFVYGVTKATGDGGSSPLDDKESTLTPAQQGVNNRITLIESGNHNWGKGGSSAKGDIGKALFARIVQSWLKAFGGKKADAEKTVKDSGEVKAHYTLTVAAAAKAKVTDESVIVAKAARDFAALQIEITELVEGERAAERALQVAENARMADWGVVVTSTGGDDSGDSDTPSDDNDSDES